MLYWTNWNQQHPTIERSFMNGTQRQVIVQENLVMPHGLALDLHRQRIYWANNLHFGSFRIERSSMDGSDRQLVYSGSGQFIFSLTVNLYNKKGR